MKKSYVQDMISNIDLKDQIFHISALYPAQSDFLNPPPTFKWLFYFYGSGESTVYRSFITLLNVKRDSCEMWDKRDFAACIFIHFFILTHRLIIPKKWTLKVVDFYTFLISSYICIFIFSSRFYINILLLFIYFIYFLYYFMSF